jgi:hypothetical protein
MRTKHNRRPRRPRPAVPPPLWTLDDDDAAAVIVQLQTRPD